MASIIQNFPSAELSKKGPALLRTVEAWYFSLSAYACSIDKGANAPQPSIWVPGKDAANEAGCLCSFAQDTSTLVLAFDGGLPLVIQSLELHCSKQKLTTQPPFYFTAEDGVGEDAEVVTEYNSCLLSLLSGIEPALSRLVSTGKTPLKILCTGFCMGGGLAVLAAPWAALKWPNSDVSCITFGAPIIGNPGFNKSFNLLVGLSYRGIYRLDPVPDMPRPFNTLSIKLCATGDDFYFDGRGTHSRNPRSRPLLTLHHNLSDHSTTAYEKGISAAASSPGPGVPATADGRAVLIDPLVAGQVPELAERGDCSCAQCPCTAVSENTRNATRSYAVIQTDIDNLKNLERKLENTIAAHNEQEWKKKERKVAVAKSRKDRDLEKVNTEMHRTSAHIEAAPLPSCMASSSNAFCSCLRCLSSPVLGETSVFTSCKGGNGSGSSGSSSGGFILPGGGGNGSDEDPRSVRLDQFWAEMHLQAEALRESSDEVMSYMHQVFLGKKTQPPEVVQTAMAAAVRLGQQSYGNTSIETTHGFNTNDGDHRNQTSDDSGVCSEEVAVELPSLGSTSTTPAIAIEKDRIKRVAAKRLALPATCANASYLSTAEQFSIATKIESVTCVRDPRTDATVFIGWIPGESSAVFSFRGTASRSDALTDLKILPRQIEFLPKLFPGATAHLGFLTHFTGLTSATHEERNVATALLKLTGGKPPARVICTGHSMGGALACLGATWAALQFPTAEIRCITFGAPRVGNSRFIRAFKTLVGMRIRVVHGADPIPAVPPPLRYTHFQPAVFLRRNGRLEWRPEGWNRRLALALSDHHMLKYISSVAAVLDVKEMEQGEVGEVGEGEAEQRERKEMLAVTAAVMRAPWTWLQALGSRDV